MSDIEGPSRTVEATRVGASERGSERVSIKKEEVRVKNLGARPRTR